MRPHGLHVQLNVNLRAANGIVHLRVPTRGVDLRLLREVRRVVPRLAGQGLLRPVFHRG